jgi:hypothetical protein
VKIAHVIHLVVFMIPHGIIHGISVELFMVSLWKYAWNLCGSIHCISVEVFIVQYLCGSIHGISVVVFIVSLW